LTKRKRGRNRRIQIKGAHLVNRQSDSKQLKLLVVLIVAAQVACPCRLPASSACYSFFVVV
jgi:hypothetical protein